VPAVIVIVAIVWAWQADRPRRLLARAELEASRKDWTAALRDWRELNRSSSASVHSYIGEAKACLALNRALQAERAFIRALAIDPADPEPWLYRLEMLRVEDRLLEAHHVGWAAYDAVPPGARRSILQALTLALLADTPDDLARRTLHQWTIADPDDAEAYAALFRRMATNPREGDPPRAQRIAILERLLERDPGAVNIREALVIEFADSGEIERGRAVLAAWPESARDARYDRLRGRWDLEFDRTPDEAVKAFQRVLDALPHDWRTRYRLARALRIIKRPDESKVEAERLSRLLEVLDPARLGRRLDAAIDHLDDPKSRLELADLCDRAGLSRLAGAWRADATEVTPTVFPGAR
jgi:thioredoxin-like negative regulator of GroEL